MPAHKWKHQSGKWYRFMLDENPMSEIPSHINYPGTYAIFVDRECLYVGQSGNVLKRLKNHLRLARYTNLWKTPWAYYPRILIAVRRERFRYERLAIEKRLIDKFKPRYNILLKKNNE